MITVNVEGIDKPLTFPDGTDPAVIQQTVKKVLASPITISSPSQPFEGDQGPLEGAGSAALTMGTGAVAGLISGVGGAIDATVNQESNRVANVMGNFNEDFTYAPSPEGQEVLANLGDQVTKIGKILSLPVDAFDALLTGLISGSGDDVAKRFDQNRSGEVTRGDRVLSADLGPLAATAAQIGPEVALEALAGAGGGQAVKSIPRALESVQGRFRKAVDAPEIQVFDESGRFTEEAIARLEEMQTPRVSSEAGPATTADEAAGIDAAISQLDEVDEIITEAGELGAVLTVEQARRLNLFTERGVPALKADITRNTADSISQQQRIKEGAGEPALIVAEQEMALTKAIEGGIENTGSIAVDAEEMGTSVAGVIKNRATELDNQITEAYAVAKETSQGQALVNLTDYIEFVKSQRGKENITGGVLTSAMTDLRNNGLLGKDANPLVPVEVAERLRQDLNANFSGAKPPGRVMIRQLKDKIDNDVIAAVGDDVFGDARAAKVRFHNALAKAKRDKFDTTKGSIIEDILNNKIDEERIFEHIVKRSTRSADIAKLREFLVKEGGEEGLQAWYDVKGQVLRHALDQALGTLQIREGGHAAFNVNKFRNEIKRVKGAKYDILFNADEKKLISDIIEIGMARIPISGTALGEGATSVAVKRATSQVRTDLLNRIPLVGPLAEGMVDFLSNRKIDKDLTQFTTETEKTLRKPR